MPSTRRPAPAPDSASEPFRPSPIAAPAGERSDSTESTELARRLAPLAVDHETCARDLVNATARETFDWTLAWPLEWDAEHVGRELERGFATWAREQTWRGPCAQFLDTLRRTWRTYARRGRGVLQGLVAEELGLWMWSVEEGVDFLGEHDVAWSGEPLARGRRMPLRSAVARHAAEELGDGETVLANAWSDTLATALERAWADGKRPRLLIGEGLPYFDGRRMARRLLDEGVFVTLVYDAALVAAIPRADRVWIATEAIGAREFAARIGTCTLVEEAARRDVPVSLLATSDKLVPGGALELPPWCERMPELLWREPEDGVELEPQCFEAVPNELFPDVITEAGRERFADLALRALRPNVEPPCGALEDTVS